MEIDVFFILFYKFYKTTILYTTSIEQMILTILKLIKLHYFFEYLSKNQLNSRLS